MNKIYLIFLFLFVYLATAQTVGYAHPLYASSFANANENVTVYRFRILNNETTPTLPFRVWLTSDMNWFDSAIFSYLLQPDGSDDNSPYWDMPPVYSNESAEISFKVNRTVGLPDRIAVRTEALNKWSSVCKIIPYSGSNESDQKIETYLQDLNKSKDVTIYYEEGKYALAKIDNYGTYAVFSLDNVTMIEDEKIVTNLVTNYAKKATVPKNINLSKIKEALEESKRLKSGPEKDCYRISGMDRFACIDRDSCLYACFSVPVCSNIGQSGWSFLDTLRDYNKTVQTANTGLDNAIASSADIELAPTYERAVNLLQELIDLNRAETKVIYHPLYTSYGFCEPAEYGIPIQMGARRYLLDYLEANCLYGEKDLIIKESLHTAATLNPPKPKLNNTINNTLNITPVLTPQDNDINLLNITTSNNISTDEDCCFIGMCSVGGIKKIGGLCWQLGVIAVIVVLVVGLLAIFRKPRKRK